MQTDTLFQEYFQTVPEAIFELLGYTPLCRYRFESPVVKASERRMDGFLEPVDANCPYFFVEFQGYHERGFYWRFVQEIARYHQIRPDLDGTNWQAILLLLDTAFDPGLETLGPFYNQNDAWIVRASIPDLLSQRPNASAPLNVLRPLVVQNAAEVAENGAGWVAAIADDPTLDARQRETLVDLLVKFLIQRFTELPYEEIAKMLQLAPIEDTRAYRELTQIGRNEGREEGREEGRQEGVRKGIRAVLHLRFPSATIDELATAMATVNSIKDESLLEVLLDQAAVTESLATFQQQTLDAQRALAALRRQTAENG